MSASGLISRHQQSTPIKNSVVPLSTTSESYAAIWVCHFGEEEPDTLEAYLFDEACRLEQTGPLWTQAKRFLKEQSILYPNDEMLLRLVVNTAPGCA